MKTQNQKRQQIETVKSFLESHSVVSAYPSESARIFGKRKKIYIDGEHKTGKELENILFVFATENGFATDNYIGFARDLVKQLKSDA